jgi:hypothetical protein
MFLPAGSRGKQTFAAGKKRMRFRAGSVLPE